MMVYFYRVAACEVEFIIPVNFVSPSNAKQKCQKRRPDRLLSIISDSWIP